MTSATLKIMSAVLLSLPQLAVQPALDRQILRVGDFVRGDHVGPQRQELVQRLAQQPLPAFHLEIALAEVVHIAVAEDGVQRVVDRDIARARAHDHAQLRFVVDRLPVGLQRDVFVMGGDGVVELAEQHRLVRRRHARFGRVLGIIQADAEDLARVGHSRSVSQIGFIQDRALRPRWLRPGRAAAPARAALVCKPRPA